MKTCKILLIALFISASRIVYAQEVPQDITDALRSDDAVALTKLLNKDNINACYGNYSLLSNAIKGNAPNCFDLLIKKGSDVNKICNSYVPPIMHAIKYGHLDMVKALVTHGARTDYTYNGAIFTNGPEKGETPLSYAKKYAHQDIVAYLESLKK